MNDQLHDPRVSRPAHPAQWHVAVRITAAAIQNAGQPGQALNRHAHNAPFATATCKPARACGSMLATPKAIPTLEAECRSAHLTPAIAQAVISTNI